MDQSQLDAIDAIVDLARSARVEEARGALGAWVDSSPELAAQWYLLAKLIFSSPTDLSAVIEERLRAYGAVPAKVYRSAVTALDNSLAPPSQQQQQEEEETAAGMGASAAALARLEALLARLQQSPGSDAETAAALTALNTLLERIAHQRQGPAVANLTAFLERLAGSGGAAEEEPALVHLRQLQAAIHHFREEHP